MWLLIVLAAIGRPTPQEPAVDDLLRAGRAYVASYVDRVSGALLDERYTLTEVTSDRMMTPARISSDLLLVNVNGAAIALRDAYAVNGAKIREAQPRLPALLAAPTADTWTRAQNHAVQTKRYFLAETVARLNDPMLALQFLAPVDASKFRYAIDGRKRMNDTAVVGLRFVEIRGDATRYVLGTRGNASAAGRIWIDPSTGTIHQTELQVESKIEVARVTVTYAHHPSLDLWLPSKTSETYQEREGGGDPADLAAGSSAMQKFEANASYSNPRYSRIDLTPITRR